MIRRLAADGPAWLFTVHFEPLPSPDPLHPLLIHHPTGGSRPWRDPAVAIAGNTKAAERRRHSRYAEREFSAGAGEAVADILARPGLRSGPVLSGANWRALQQVGTFDRYPVVCNPVNGLPPRYCNDPSPPLPNGEPRLHSNGAPSLTVLAWLAIQSARPRLAIVRLRSLLPPNQTGYEPLSYRGLDLIRHRCRLSSMR